ncbi:MAG: DNA translocase FtsK 4TM domain-containing protein, partial [Anaerolineae bacterium]
MTKRPAGRSTSRTSPASRSRSTVTGRASARSTSPRSTSSGRPNRNAPVRRKTRRTGPHLHINWVQVTWAAGVLLLGIALITLLSVLFGNRGRVTEWWVSALTQAFGWGRYAVPIVLGTLSVWLLTRLSGQAMAMPWKRLAGGLLLLVTALGLAHHLSPDQELAMAEGTGGGWLGYQISVGLQAALGWAGSVVVFVLLLAVALTLLLNVSLDELVSDIATFGKRLQAGQAERARLNKAIRPAGSAPAARSQTQTAPASSGRASVTSTHSGSAAARPTSPAALPFAPAASAAAARVTMPPLQDADVPDVAVYEEHRWMLPPAEEMLALDDEPPMSLRDIREKTRIIEETLLSLGVPVSVVEVNPGPVVTQFGLEPGYV